ncbi:hypothetical protein ONJ45_26560, partial [Salmonella enterica subsp. enterica serovar Virginia]|nr:hypothetical protein [Salmonella enterica subsp. enterica serovar Virginia]
NNQLIKEYPPHTDADIEAALQKADALYHSDWSKGEIDQRLPVSVDRKAFQSLLVEMLKENNIEFVHVKEADYDGRFLRCVELVK